MADIPAGAIPIDEFESASSNTIEPMAPNEGLDASSVPEGAIPIEQFEIDEKADSSIEQIKAGLEGAARGIAGPLATMTEKRFGVKPEDIVRRQQDFPTTAMASEAAGLIGGALIPGPTQAKLMAQIGNKALAGAKAANIINVANEAKLGYKLGSEAVKQAAEMAVLSSGNEAHKMLINDPESSAENAITNIGLSTVLGGAGGVAFGAINPLWKATAGPKVEQMLNYMSGKFKPVELPETIASAFKDLDIVPGPIATAAMSGDQKALSQVQDLVRAQHSKTLSELGTYPKQIRDNLSKHLGMPLDDITNFSNKESGDAVKEQLAKSIEKKYGPINKEQQAKQANAESINMHDEDRLNFAGKIVEKGINAVETDSPYYKIYSDYAERVLAKNTVGQLDKLNTEILNRARTHVIDINEKNALHDVSRMINDFTESQIEKQATKLGVEGLSPLIQAERQAAKQNYKQYVNQLQELMDFMGVGNWKGTGSLINKLDDLTSEQIIKKFSTSGDTAGLKMLQKEFPEVAELVRQHETKQFLSGAVHKELGETVLDSKKLISKMEKLASSGQKERIDYLLPNGAADKLRSADILHDAITNVTRMKDSGTPSGLAKVFRHLGASSLGAIGWMMGKNPISAAIIGEATQRLAVDLPQEVKFAMLKFMASPQSVNAEGFHAMVQMANQVSKSVAKINKATANVIKPGSQVVASMPTQVDRDKLQKQIDKNMDNPDHMIAAQAQSNLGHYMPEAQVSIAKASATAVQYLESIKPKPMKLGPMDREIPPSKQEMARYNRALDIAINPITVLQHVKDGTLQTSDIQDLNSMYPGLYKQFSDKLINDTVSAEATEQTVPYKTKVGISLFLGTELDSSMRPSSIQAAQPKPKAQPQPAPSGTNGPKSIKSLSKLPGQYETPTQAAEQANQSDK